MNKCDGQQMKEKTQFVEFMVPAGTPSVCHIIHTVKALQTNLTFSFCQCGFVTVT